MSVVTPVGQANIVAARAPGSLGLSVFADLRLDTEGHRVHVVGDGRSVVVHTSDPRTLLRDVREMSLPVEFSGWSGRTSLGRAATALSRAGLRVDVRGTDGVLVTLGAGTESRFGRIVTGSSAVQFGQIRDLTAAARLPVKRIAVVVLAGMAVGAVLLRRRAE